MKTYPYLTEREKEVLELVYKGYSNRQIAEQIIVSVHTAKAHVCKLLEKFDTSTRVELAVMAAEMFSNNEYSNENQDEGLVQSSVEKLSLDGLHLLISRKKLKKLINQYLKKTNAKIVFCP